MSSQPRTVFFTHNWGENNTNHNQCREIAQVLKNEGIPVWFDEDHMEGQIADAMVDGIDDSDVLLIAITPTYIAKINSKNLADNCLREFNYALDQPRFADKFVCIVTDEDALDMRLWKGAFKMKVHNPLAINLCPSLKGEEREKNLRDLAMLLKRKLAQNEKSNGGSIEAAQDAFAKVRLDIVWGTDTSLTIESLTILLDLADVPKPRDIASLLIASNNDSLKKLSGLSNEDLRALQITPENSKLIFDGIIAKLRRAESFEAELEAASEVKTRMFWAFMARSAQEAAASCAAIKRFLTENSKYNSRALFDLGCNEAIVAALQRYAVDVRVAEQACAAIGFISKEFWNELTKLGKTGAGKAVVAALKRFGTENSQVAQQACLVIGYLALNDTNNEQKFGQIDACEAVIAALNRFGTENAEVTQQACWAIDYLAYNRANNQKFGQLGACEAVIAALKRFGAENEKVAEIGCSVVINLALNDANKNKLVQIGVCEVVVVALQRFGAESANVAEYGCWAICSLADNDANQHKFKEIGAKAAVSQCLENRFKRRALSEV